MHLHSGSAAAAPNHAVPLLQGHPSHAERHPAHNDAGRHLWGLAQGGVALAGPSRARADDELMSAEEAARIATVSFREQQRTIIHSACCWGEEVPCAGSDGC